MLQVVELFVKLFVIFFYVIWPRPQHHRATTIIISKPLDVNLRAATLLDVVRLKAPHTVENHMKIGCLAKQVLNPAQN